MLSNTNVFAPMPAVLLAYLPIEMCTYQLPHCLIMRCAFWIAVYHCLIE